MVTKGDNGKLNAFYADSFGPIHLPDGASSLNPPADSYYFTFSSMRQLLEEQPNIEFFDLSVKQQSDYSSCGIWALEHVRILNQANIDGIRDPNDIKGLMQTEAKDPSELRLEFANTLEENNGQAMIEPEQVDNGGSDADEESLYDSAEDSITTDEEEEEDEDEEDIGDEDVIDVHPSLQNDIPGNDYYMISDNDYEVPDQDGFDEISIGQQYTFFKANPTIETFSNMLTAFMTNQRGYRTKFFKFIWDQVKNIDQLGPADANEMFKTVIYQLNWHHWRIRRSKHLDQHLPICSTRICGWC